MKRRTQINWRADMAWNGLIPSPKQAIDFGDSFRLNKVTLLGSLIFDRKGVSGCPQFITKP